MATVSIDLDFPQGIRVVSHIRLDNGAYSFEVDWDLPLTCTCDQCGATSDRPPEWRDQVRVVRDLDLRESPCFWSYQVGFYRCQQCNRRQFILPDFKRPDTGYTFRFEVHVMRMLIGSTEQDVARRLGISAETVRHIVRAQIGAEQAIDPQRVITHLGIDEISLKKRHKMYVTILTDLSDPNIPRVLAVANGKDEKAAAECLNRLTEAQRAQVKTYRVDMGLAYPKACKSALPHARAVVDRFHVAKKFNEVVDRARKKITQSFRTTLTKAERKAFRTRMWEFRRRPESLSVKERQLLAELFEELPKLRMLYEMKNRFTQIFDKSANRRTASLKLMQLQFDAQDAGVDLAAFFEVTYENWTEEILNYFDRSLWDRLTLDLNLAASQANGPSIACVRNMVRVLRDVLRPCCV